MAVEIRANSIRLIKCDSKSLLKVVNRGSMDKRFNDPKWADQWYLRGQQPGKKLSMRVQEAWDAGFTGKGVTVTILDDGIETDHPDLKRNYLDKAGVFH